jgi:hypothetical protein
MKLAGGEGNRGIHEFRTLLERGCFDIVQPEVMLKGLEIFNDVPIGNYEYPFQIFENHRRWIRMVTSTCRKGRAWA